MWPRPFKQSPVVLSIDRPVRWGRSIGLSILVLCLLGIPTLQGQEATDDLRAEASEAFEVLPTRVGLLLRPRSSETTARTVEIIDDEVAVDGELVTGSALDDRLGDLAPTVRSLLELSARDRRVALGLEEPAPRRVEVTPTDDPRVVVTPADAEAYAVAEEDESAGESEGDEGDEGDKEPRVRVSLDSGGFNVKVEQTPRIDLGQRVTLGKGVEVAADEEAEEAVAIGGPVRVYGEVEQDVLAVGGSAHVDGKVGGEVVAVGGSVYLGSEAEVMGNVTSVGGKVNREAGAEVGGVVSEVSMGRLFAGTAFQSDDDDRYTRSTRRSGRVGSFFGQIAWAFFLALLVWLIGIVFARPMERLEDKVRFDAARAGLAGFLTQILFFPLVLVAAIILVISVIGIPLLVLMPVVIFLFAVAMLFGYAASARVLARSVGARFGRNFGNGLKLALVGIGALHIWSIIASFFDVIGGPLHFFAVMFLLFGILVQYLAVTIGLGAVILTRFGAGPKEPPASLTPPSVPPPFEPLAPIAPSSTPPPAPTDSALAVPDEDLRPATAPESTWVEMDDPVEEREDDPAFAESPGDEFLADEPLGDGSTDDDDPESEANH